jgi:hypothetical protein
MVRYNDTSLGVILYDFPWYSLLLSLSQPIVYCVICRRYHSQTVLSKLHAHVADYLRYSQPESYNGQLIKTLHLVTTACFPGASITNGCDHWLLSLV